jgi:hypothetical protein
MSGISAAAVTARCAPLTLNAMTLVKFEAPKAACGCYLLVSSHASSIIGPRTSAVIVYECAVLPSLSEELRAHHLPNRPKLDELRRAECSR